MNKTTKQKIDAWRKRRSDRLDNRGVSEDDKWITIGGGKGGKNNNKNSPSSGGKGVHILLNDKNVVVGGAGGKFNGEKFNKVKSSGKATTEGGKKPSAPTTVIAKFVKEKLRSTFTDKPAKRKSFDEFAKTIEGFGASDKKVAALYENIDKVFEKMGKFNITMKNPGHPYKCWFASYSLGGKLTGETEIKIPTIKKDDPPEEKRVKSRTIVHEMGHMMDFILRKTADKHGHFSGEFAPLIDAISKDDGSIGEESQKIVDDFIAKKKEFDKNLLDDFNKKTEQLKIDTGFKKPDGHSDWDKYKEYKKQFNKAEKQYKYDRDMGKRKMVDGNDALMDIYDALQKGALHKKGTFGHGAKYYSSVVNRATEIMANFMDIKMTNPEACRILKKEKPEFFAACEQCVDGMLKEFGIEIE